MDSVCKFSLGDKLVWNSSTETLSITGTVNIDSVSSGFAQIAGTVGAVSGSSNPSAMESVSQQYLNAHFIKRMYY